MALEKKNSNDDPLMNKETRITLNQEQTIQCHMKHRLTMAPSENVSKRFFPHSLDRSFYYDDKKLHNIRALFLIINSIHYFGSLYYYYASTLFENLEYLTYWGWTLVLIFQAMVLFCKPRSRKMEIATQSVHHCAFTLQIFIATMFWVALLPSILFGFDGTAIPSSYYYQYIGFFEHSFPAFSIFYDYCVSTVKYTEHGWFLHTGVVIAYVVQSTLMYNLVGIYIYPTPLSNFKDWKTYVAMVIWIILNIVLAYYLMALKREFNRKRNFYWNGVIDELIASGVYEDDQNKDDIYEDIRIVEKGLDPEEQNSDDSLPQKKISDYIKLEEEIMSPIPSPRK